MANVVYRTEIRPENRASMRKDGAQSASSSWIMVRGATHELVGYAGLCASRVWLTSRLQMPLPAWAAERPSLFDHGSRSEPSVGRLRRHVRFSRLVDIPATDAPPRRGCGAAQAVGSWSAERPMSWSASPVCALRAFG